MKNLHISAIKAIIALLVVLVIASCTKLKDESYNTLISSQFNASEQDLAALAGAAYVNWRDVLLEWNGLYRAQEVSGDQMLTPARPNGWVDGGVYRRIHEHKWTTDDDIVVNTWNRSYAGITNCNRVIYQVQAGTIPVDPQDTAALVAEMRLLRASYYWVLCDYYGNVPIIARFDVPEGFLPKQNTRKEVYDFIVKEIIDNKDKVSAENNTATYGKFNKWAGLHLLAKMYLNAGVYTGNYECI